MKYFYLFFLALLNIFYVSAQTTRIENVRIELSAGTDSMLVTYNITGRAVLNNVQLLVSNEAGETIPVKSVSGAFGNRVLPGKNKTIVWNMATDSIDVYGKHLMVRVTGKEWVPFVQAKPKRWIPWLYIASGASAATGVFAHIKAQNIFNNQYLPVSNTKNAGTYHTQVRNWEIVRDIALGTAGVYGALGAVVHVKHNKEKQAITLNYYPQPRGAEFGLTYNF